MSSTTMTHSACQFSESSFYVSNSPMEKTQATFSDETVDSQQFKTSFYNPFEIKRRKRTTRVQFKVLEKTFLENSKPNASMRRWLAEQLDMTPRGVQVWFQNRRAKAKTTNKSEPMARQLSCSMPEKEELLLTPVTPLVDFTWAPFQWNLPDDNKIPPHASYFAQPMSACYFEPRLFEPIFEPILEQTLTFYNHFDLYERQQRL